MQRTLLAAMLTTTLAGAAAAEPALTIYRGDSDALYDGGGGNVAEGHAIVHESRTLALAGGRQTVVIDGLPATLNPEAVAVDLGGAARVLAQRVIGAGDGGALAAHRGQRVTARFAGGFVSGTLIGVTGDSLVLRDDEAGGGIKYVRDYQLVEFDRGAGAPGSSLQLALDGGSGSVPATLTYPTSGLGWRAAYAALLKDGDCSLRLDALASIANRSGRDFPAAKLKLIAGSPNFASQGGPRPRMMMKAMSAQAAPDALPDQSALGDYRSYAIDGTLDLPDGSVTQVPLYAGRDVACERRWVYEIGSAWFAQKPVLEENGMESAAAPISSQLKFAAAENLPAGTLRVLARGRDGNAELLGENRIADTAKGRDVNVELGIAFDLAATRERTAFSVDRAAHEMNEGFRITLTNSGEAARTVTVRDHPNRWRGWSVLSSSQKPDRQTPDTIEFRVPVPAGGRAVLDYAIRYTWTAAEG